MSKERVGKKWRLFSPRFSAIRANRGLCLVPVLTKNGFAGPGGERRNGLRGEAGARAEPYANNRYVVVMDVVT